MEGLKLPVQSLKLHVQSLNYMYSSLITCTALKVHVQSLNYMYNSLNYMYNPLNYMYNPLNYMYSPFKWKLCTQICFIFSNFLNFQQNNFFTKSLMSLFYHIWNYCIILSYLELLHDFYRMAVYKIASSKLLLTVLLNSQK